MSRGPARSGEFSGDARERATASEKSPGDGRRAAPVLAGRVERWQDRMQECTKQRPLAGYSARERSVPPARVRIRAQLI